MFLSAFRKLRKATPEGVKDIFAMLFSALLVIVLPCLLILCALCATGLLLLGVY